MGAGGRDLPVEIDSLLSELPIAMVRVLKGLVLHDLHPFSPVALLVTVFADHIQLSDFVLQSKQRNGDRVSPSLPLMNPHTALQQQDAQQRVTSAPSAEKSHQSFGSEVTVLGAWQRIGCEQNAEAGVPVNNISSHTKRSLGLWQS